MTESQTAETERNRPAAVLSSVLAGLVGGVLAVTFLYSYAAVILADADPTSVPRLAGHFMIGGAAVTVIVALKSELKGVVALPQDTPAAVLVVVVGAVIAGSEGATDSESLFATILALIVTSTVVGAVLFWFVGTFRLAVMGQYVPYPVVAGFLASTGWLLFKSSFGVMGGVSFDFENLDDLWDQFDLWAPGVAMAVVMILATRRWSDASVVPATIVVATIGYHVVRVAQGDSLTDAAADGWLLEPLGSGPLIEPIDVGGIQWSIIVSESVGMVTVLIIATIGVLLNLTALSTTFRQDIDVDREMRILGVSNVIAAAGGSIIGFHYVSLSTLGRKMGGNSRAIGLVVAAVCLGVATVGAAGLSYIPQFVLGGMVLYIGVGLLNDWLIGPVRNLSRVDVAIVLVILAVVEIVGFLEGVAAGLLVTIIHFVVTYSRTGAIRQVISGREMHSTIERSTAHRHRLASAEDGIIIIKLQGYIFFASTVGLVDAVAERIAAEDPVVSHVILDFEHVTGVDESGFQGFAKLERVAEDRSVQLCYSTMARAVRSRLRGQPPATDPNETAPLMFDSADTALEWCEDDVLRKCGVDPQTEEFSFDYTLREMFDDLAQLDSFRSRLEIVELRAGETVVASGQAAAHIDFVESGRVTVLGSSEEGTARIRRAGPGSILGMASFFRHGGQRSLATIRAETDCRLRRLTSESYRDLASSEPEVAASLQRHALVAISDRFASLLSSFESVMRSRR